MGFGMAANSTAVYYRRAKTPRIFTRCSSSRDGKPMLCKQKITLGKFVCGVSAIRCQSILGIGAPRNSVVKGGGEADFLAAYKKLQVCIVIIQNVHLLWEKYARIFKILEV